MKNKETLFGCCINEFCCHFGEKTEIEQKKNTICNLFCRGCGYPLAEYNFSVGTTNDQSQDDDYYYEYATD
jgi:hypothetical protein